MKALLVVVVVLGLAGAVLLGSLAPSGSRSPLEIQHNQVEGRRTPVLRGRPYLESARTEAADASGRRPSKDAYSAWLLGDLIERGDVAALRSALDSGADCNSGMRLPGRSQLTLLEWSLLCRSFRATVLLLERSADPRTAFPGDYSDNGERLGSPRDLKRFVERRILPLAWSASPREHSDLRALASALQGLIGDEELVRDPDFALVLATMANAESRAEEALSAGASPARRFVSSGGEVESTALTLAAELRHYRLVERFARAYDTSDWVAPLTAARYEPIARAAASGDILALQELLPGLTWTGGGERDELDGGTSPPCSDSPLFHAAENGQTEMVRVLLDAGISIDGACDPAYPVLAAAIRGENPIVVQMLIDRGAPLRTHVFDSLMYCITNDAADVVSVILRASVSINALPAAALLPGSEVTVLIDPLTYAVAMLSAASVRALLDAGASPNGMARTIEVTPLEWAARIGHRQILRLLIEAGADTDTLFRPGPDGRSAMDLVSVRGWKDLEDFIRSVSKR